MYPKTYEITVRRSIAATPEQVFTAWSDPDCYNRVHGCHETAIDFREGGTIVTRFFADREGGENFVLWKIDAPRRLEFTWREHEAFRVTLTCEPVGDRTLVALTQQCQDDLDWIGNCLNGWAWILDFLESYFTTGQGLDAAAWTKENATHQVVPRSK